MQATAIAHPNIALVKYWGKRDVALNLPAAGSLSLTLAGLSTTTRVVFDASLTRDHVVLDGEELGDCRAYKRVAEFLDLVRNRAETKEFARVETINDFPTAAGLASSASGFAALAMAASHAAGLSLSTEEAAILARRGSGSAARSLYSGFCEMKAGSRDDGKDAHPVAIAPEDHWDLRCLVALTAEGEKEVGSTEGMALTQETSPFFKPFIDTVDPDIAAAKKAIKDRDFELLTEVAERSCLRMHASALGADPGILYFNATTLSVLHAVRNARRDGLSVFFTVDAGPHVKVFCPSETAADAETFLKTIKGVGSVVETRPGAGAHLI